MIKEILKWIKDNRITVAVAIIAFFQLSYYLGCDYIGIEHADTVSYVYHSFAISDLSARPPLYPLLIAISRGIVGDNRSYFVVCMFQILVSIISVYYFYKAGKIAFKRDNVALILTVFYGCNPAPLYWNNCIMTESLAISLTVFFLYHLVKYVDDIDKNYKNGIYAAIIALIAMMIKPTLVIYLGVCIALLFLQLILCKLSRKPILKVAVAVCICFSIVIVYASIIKKNNGMFNVSNLGPRHALAVSLATETYKNYPDKEIVAKIDEIYDSYGRDFGEHAGTTEIMKLFGDDIISQNKGTSEFVRICNENASEAKLKFVLGNAEESFLHEAYTLGWLYHKKPNALVNLFGNIHKYIFGVVENRLCWLFIIPFVELIMTVVLWIKNKECPWLHLGIFGTLFVIIVSNYWGSYDSFYRLTVYAMPLLYFGVGLEVSSS